MAEVLKFQRPAAAHLNAIEERVLKQVDVLCQVRALLFGMQSLLIQERDIVHVEHVLQVAQDLLEGVVLTGLETTGLLASPSQVQS